MANKAINFSSKLQVRHNDVYAFYGSRKKEGYGDTFDFLNIVFMLEKLGTLTLSYKNPIYSVRTRIGFATLLKFWSKVSIAKGS
jgi:hypothetical protein